MPEMERRSFLDWPLQVFRSLSLDSHPNSKHHRAGLLVEVGSRRHRLKSGDSILDPGRLHMLWAFVGNTPGRLILA